MRPITAAAPLPTASTGTPAPTRAPYALAIVGAGALGLHFATRLAGVGPVAVIARNAARAQRLRAGIRVGNTLHRIDAFAPEEAPAADWVIVLVKAGDTLEAVQVATTLQPQGILSLQNGLVETLLQTAGGDRLIGQGITTEGAFRERDGDGDGDGDGERIVPAGAGDTLLPPGFEPVAALLVRAGFRARVEAQIAAARLAKLLVNVAINPLAAIHQVPNGQLLLPPYQDTLVQLVREAWPVLRVAGLALDEQAALDHVRAVAAATASNLASMLQDRMAGRRTEIDALTGTLLALGARQGVEMPTHRALYEQVKRFETT
jgi:2-dehydropantoate 2-reductase